MAFFAKNTSGIYTLLFKGGFIEIKPGQAVEVQESDVNEGVFASEVVTGRISVYESEDFADTIVEQNRVDFPFRAVNLDDVAEEVVADGLPAGQAEQSVNEEAPLTVDAAKSGHPTSDSPVPVATTDAADASSTSNDGSADTTAVNAAEQDSGATEVESTASTEHSYDISVPVSDAVSSAEHDGELLPVLGDVSISVPDGLDKNFGEADTEEVVEVSDTLEAPKKKRGRAPKA